MLVTMRGGEFQVEIRTDVKHLGMTLDSKLTYWRQIEQAADKAVRGYRSSK